MSCYNDEMEENLFWEHIVFNHETCVKIKGKKS